MKLAKKQDSSGIKIDIGSGRIGNKWKSSFGLQDMELQPSMADMSILQITEELVRQLKLPDGEIIMRSISFSYTINDDNYSS